VINAIEWVLPDPTEIEWVKIGFPLVGEPTLISAKIKAECCVVSVTVTITNGTHVWTVELYDDGAHDDGAAGDGVYANTFVFPSEGTYDWEVEVVDCNGLTDSESGTLEAVKGNVVGEGRVAMKIAGKWYRGPGTVVVVDVEDIHVIRVTGELEGYGEVEVEFRIVRKTVTPTMAIYIGRSREWGYFVLRVRVPSMIGYGRGSRVRFFGKIVYYGS